MKLPQLSLRELFLLVALAAMGWVERRKLIDCCATLEEQAKALEEKVALAELLAKVAHQGQIDRAEQEAATAEIREQLRPSMVPVIPYAGGRRMPAD